VMGQVYHYAYVRVHPMLEPIEAGGTWTSVTECEVCSTTCSVRFEHTVDELGPSLKAQLPPGWAFFKEAPTSTAIMCPEHAVTQSHD